MCPSAHTNTNLLTPVYFPGAIRWSQNNRTSTSRGHRFQGHVVGEGRAAVSRAPRDRWGMSSERSTKVSTEYVLVREREFGNEITGFMFSSPTIMECVYVKSSSATPLSSVTTGLSELTNITHQGIHLCLTKMRFIRTTQARSCNVHIIFSQKLCSYLPFL